MCFAADGFRPARRCEIGIFCAKRVFFFFFFSDFFFFFFAAFFFCLVDNATRAIETYTLMSEKHSNKPVSQSLICTTTTHVSRQRCSSPNATKSRKKSRKKKQNFFLASRADRALIDVRRSNAQQNINDTHRNQHSARTHTQSRSLTFSQSSFRLR
jgi:hypothetical protein